MVQVNKNVVVICLTAIAISVIGVAGWIVFVGGDSERITGWVGTTIGPLILGLANYLKTAHVSDDVRVVRKRTNGTLDLVFERLRALEGRAGPNRPTPGAAPAVTHEDAEGGPPSTTAPG